MWRNRPLAEPFQIICLPGFVTSFTIKDMTEPILSCLSLANLEDAVDRIARKMPGSPREEVILTRLHFYTQLQLDAWFNASLKPYELNETTWMALMLIYSRPDERVSPSDISSAMAFSRTNATRVVDELEKKGWIRRQPSIEDRRKTELALTEAGQALVREVLPVQRARLKELWQDFSAEECRQLETLERKLLARLTG